MKKYGEKRYDHKKFMQNAEIFADAFNYYMYGGKQVIKPESLRELDTVAIALPYGDDNKSELIQKFRDLMKMAAIMADENAIYLILGMENQSEVHYAMPVRNMLYDAVKYSDQVISAAKSHKKSGNTGSSRAEYLSGFRKTDKLLPVITLVVYFGADEWDAPRSLHEMMAIQDKQILEYVPDYRINLIAPLEIPDEEFARFGTELSVVLKYIKYSKDKSKLNAILHSDESFRNVTRQAAEVINTVTNSKFEFNEREESVDMCKAIEDIRNDAIQEGKAEGRAEGKAEGRAEGKAEAFKEALASMIKNGISEEQAKRILGMA